MKKILLHNVKQNSKLFLQKELSRFNQSDLPNKDSIIKISITFLSIVGSSFLFYAFATSLVSRPNLMAYLLTACEEGVSVYFWNILAAIGFLLLGVMILFPFKYFAKVSSVILSSVNSISAVMFGLLAAQMAYGITTSSAKLWVKIWGFGLGGIVCLLVLLCFIIFIWVFSYLPRQDSFLNKLRQTSLAIRIPAASIMLSAPLVWGYLLD